MGGIKIRMEFWYVWARIAIVEANNSASARSRFGASADSANDSRSLDEELNSGVVAVCAVAFSLEALVLLLTPMVMEATTVQAWKTGNPTKFVSRLRETLKRSIALPGKHIEMLIKAVDPVIKARGVAVHYMGDFEQPVPHPVAIQSHQDMITYGAEKAGEAARAMCDIYKALLGHPKAAVRLWVQQEEATLRRLANPSAT
jgi:hypothetical protein